MEKTGLPDHEPKSRYIALFSFSKLLRKKTLLSRGDRRSKFESLRIILADYLCQVVRQGGHVHGKAPE